MHVWQLQEAKAKLSYVVKQCEIEPQIISLHGKEKVIMISIEDYEEMVHHKENLVTFMQNSPLMGVELDFSRDKSPDREVDL